jgi:G3E family GTPase
VNARAPGADERLPIILLTGFLGSGKTTLLHTLMQRPEWGDTAVIINELGEIALDHLLVQHVAPEVRLLKSGCLCCSVREDLTQTLGDLQARRERGELHFSRVLVETTGLADPMPVMHTLATQADTARHFRLAGVATVVDASNGFATLDRHEEARRQLAMADTVLVTKSDLASPSQLVQLESRITRLNGGAPQHLVRHGDVRSEHLLGLEHQLLSTLGPRTAQQHGTALRSAPSRSSSVFLRPHRPHATDIQTHSLVIDAPIQAEALQHWLELLTATRGEQLLRCKGLIEVTDQPEWPLLVHAAQHLIHPSRHLPTWPGGDRRSRLVCITQGIDQHLIARTLHKYTHARITFHVH